MFENAATVAHSLLPPYDTTPENALKTAMSAGGLIFELAAVIRLKSQPGMWPKPPTTSAETPEDSGAANPSPAAETPSQEAQEAA